MIKENSKTAVEGKFLHTFLDYVMFSECHFSAKRRKSKIMVMYEGKRKYTYTHIIAMCW